MGTDFLQAATAIIMGRTRKNPAGFMVIFLV
jgi:hypothetical protein